MAPLTLCVCIQCGAYTNLFQLGMLMIAAMEFAFKLTEFIEKRTRKKRVDEDGS